MVVRRAKEDLRIYKVLVRENGRANLEKQEETRIQRSMYVLVLVRKTSPVPGCNPISNLLNEAT